MKRWLLLSGLLLTVYGALMMSLSGYMAQRPIAVRLGYQPPAEVLKLISGDQRTLVAEFSMVKLMLYFGSVVEQWQRKINTPPESYNMFKTAETAIKLDPYNMDAYYFSQAAFTWEAGHAKDVIQLLKFGMKSRTWDWYLPYFIGFNAAYFLEDYTTAADYMKKAAEISGNPLFISLASRYFYESSRDKLGVVFLQTMVEKERDPKVRAAYTLRLSALQATLRIEQALSKFRILQPQGPQHLDELVSAGLLTDLPKDPYGGRFYLDKAGKVRTTSKFTRVK